MKEEALLEVLGQVDPSYLVQTDAPEKQKPSRGKLLRRSLLAAALVALLALGVSAALNNPKISVYNLNRDELR